MRQSVRSPGLLDPPSTCPAAAMSPSCAPFHGDGGLHAVLSSPEVDAVLVVLPPQAQGAVIQAALRAGA